VTPGWWRRNTFALGAVIVLVPATALIVGGHEWWSMYQAAPLFAATAEEGSEIEYARATWGPATAVEESSDEVPEGAKLIVVEVPVDPADRPVACNVPVLRELGGEQRQWDTASYDVDWSYENPTLCDSEATGPFTIAVPYLVPDDAVGPFGVDLVLSDQLPGFLRLTVSP
jgi:hypothetical protein